MNTVYGYLERGNKFINCFKVIAKARRISREISIQNYNNNDDPDVEKFICEFCDDISDNDKDYRNILFHVDIFGIEGYPIDMDTFINMIEEGEKITFLQQDESIVIHHKFGKIVYQSEPVKI